MRRTAVLAAAVAVAAAAGGALAGADGAAEAQRPDLRGLSSADQRLIRGFTGWQRLLGRPRADLRALGAAHPGTKRIYVNMSRRRLAPGGRQRFPYPVGTVVVKTGARDGDLTLVAIMRKVARGGRTDGGWDWVEYQRPSGSEPFARVAAPESVCTGCHVQAVRRQGTDWTFDTLD